MACNRSISSPSLSLCPLFSSEDRDGFLLAWEAIIKRVRRRGLMAEARLIFCIARYYFSGVISFRCEIMNIFRQ